MATGPEHYREAEALINAIDAMRDNYATDIPWHEVQAASTLAQVHATLALAAATAWCVWVDRPNDGDYGGFELSEEGESCRPRR